MSLVYFARPVSMVGPIKIGHSKQVPYRLDTLSTWSPFPLELIVAVEGRIQLERNIHECFADLHSHKEWFHAGPRLLDFIEKLKAGVPVAEATDLSIRIRPIVAIGHKKPAKPGMEGYRGYQSRLRWAEIKAARVNGEGQWIPFEIDAIMDRWRHGGFCRPTAEEFAKLDALVAAPHLHCVSRSVRFTKPAAVEVAA